MAAAGFIDPTKAGKYPVILSDALLGKKPNEVYTAMRCKHPTFCPPWPLSSALLISWVTDNHKPDTPPTLAKVKQTTSSTYDLTYQDGGSYKYRGIRASEDGKYVLIFDPTREAFVLHKVDSTFNMNLVQTPANSDADSLRREYPHLEVKKPTRNAGQAAKESKAKKPEKDKGLTVPGSKPSKPQPKQQDPESDEDDSDDDGGLVMEFPGGQPPSSNRDFSPAFPPRPFSEFVAEVDDEEEDADGEDDDDDMSEEHFKLPSPMNQTTTTPTITQYNTQSLSLQFDAEEESEEDEEPAPTQGMEASEMDVDDLEAALEAELGAELEANQSESDVSEED